MTKEQVQLHGEIIKFFIDNSDKGVWCKEKSHPTWYISYTPEWSLYNVYVQNDSYSIYRKALVEGKTIQYKAGEVKWVDIPTPSFNFPIEYYRIKPEKPKFKVGDWVTNDVNYKSIQVTSEMLESNNPEAVWWYPWKPNQNEWYFDNTNKELLKCDYVEYVGDELYVYGTTAKGNPFNAKLSDCEPFTGSFPAFITECKDEQCNNLK